MNDFQSLLKRGIVCVGGEPGQAVVSIDFQFFPDHNMSYFFSVCCVERLTHPDLTCFQDPL